MKPIEIIGLCASLLIVISMVFKTTNYRGTMAMRIINLIGCIVFIAYGFILPAYATGITNSILLILDVFYIIKEYRDHKKTCYFQSGSQK